MQLLSTNLVSAFLQLGQGFVHVRSNQFLQKKEEKNLLLRLALSFPYSFPCITFMFPADCILVFMSRPEPCTTHQFLIQHYGNLESNRLQFLRSFKSDNFFVNYVLSINQVVLDVLIDDRDKEVSDKIKRLRG